MTWVPQPPPTEQCFETLNTTLELGSNFWNAGELYGTPDYNSLHLLNKYFTQYPEKASQVVLSIKGGLKVGALVPDGSEANIRRSVDECLRLLDGKKSIDIFQCARQDPHTTVEQTVTILAQLVKEGKIGGIGLSEVDGATIRRAYVLFYSAVIAFLFRVLFLFLFLFFYPTTSSVDKKAGLTSTEPKSTPSQPLKSSFLCGTPTPSTTTSSRPAPSSTSPS